MSADAQAQVRSQPSRSTQPVGCLTSLEERLGYRFRDRGLLERALTHRSARAETGAASNERLEFLGDALLSASMVAQLHQRRPELSEAVMSEARSLTVRASTLAEVGEELQLGSHLRLAKGEALSGGRTNGRLVGDALEAVIGAVFVDGGSQAADDLVVRLMSGRVESAVRQLAPEQPAAAAQPPSS